LQNDYTPSAVTALLNSSWDIPVQEITATLGLLCMPKTRDMGPSIHKPKQKTSHRIGKDIMVSHTIMAIQLMI
jgi:hypothetical protein